MCLKHIVVLGHYFQQFSVFTFSACVRNVAISDLDTSFLSRGLLLICVDKEECESKPIQELKKNSK